ncbi:MAG TPA: glycerophosphodiester phosphodiesterase [Solirubrobacteraceae bacterium]|nr:glycerophosphodiester phosphodiesterase [Solirubrobacteraceae bacterium]
MDSSCLRIGHGGASALAPANTLASFDAALEVGVDMVEFDVREYRGDLVLAHTIFHSRRGGNPRLREALAYLSQPRFDGIEVNVDVKCGGCEPRLLEELSRAGLIERTIVSSQIPLVLDRLRELDPRLRLGISVGGRVARMSHRWRDWRAVALGGLAGRRWDVLMAQYRLIDGSLLEQVAERSGRLFAWTVNERLAIQRLTGLGVHGITTADPRLFV